MGANEIANRVEASAWIAAAGQTDGDDIGVNEVLPTDFFFRSLNGFVNRMDVLGISPGETWEDAAQGTITVVLFLDRNYARKDTTLLLQPIETFRPSTVDPAIILPVSYEGPLRVTPLSADGYSNVRTGAPPFTLPGSVDPYSVLMVSLNLGEFQVFGKGVEFGIEVLRMQDNDGPPTVTTLVDPGGP